MTSTTRIQHRYDHRLRELVRSTGDVEYAIQQGVPRSTARGWLTATGAEVVTVDIVDMDALRCASPAIFVVFVFGPSGPESESKRTLT